MTDATEYGVQSEEDNSILNHNPPGVTKDYVKDNGDKITEEIMPDKNKQEPPHRQVSAKHLKSNKKRAAVSVLSHSVFRCPVKIQSGDRGGIPFVYLIFIGFFPQVHRAYSCLVRCSVLAYSCLA